MSCSLPKTQVHDKQVAHTMLCSVGCGSFRIQAGVTHVQDAGSSPRRRRKLPFVGRPALLALVALASAVIAFGLLAAHQAVLRVAGSSASPAGSRSVLALPGWHHSDRLVDVVQHRLLLATHNVLGWYYPQYDVFEELHRGQGVHYGVFPGEAVPGHPHTVWNIIRPHNWRPAEGKEHLVMFDADTGMELKRVEVPARFTHDAIRVGHHVYVCSTGDGSILELSYPDMKLVRKLQLFSERDHPNTLAAAPGPDKHAVDFRTAEHLWVMLHNLGLSDLVKIYVGPDGPAREVARVKNTGRAAHGLVSWGNTGRLILLDSDNGMLVDLNPNNGDEVELWQAPEDGKFLKGLAVLDDVAYFGITTWSHRSVRDSPDSHGELAAFDLVRNILLWRRRVPTSGLLNVIGAPHLAVDSTYVATYTRTPLPASAIPPAFSTSPDTEQTHSASQAAAAAAAAAAAQHAYASISTGPVVLPDSQEMVQRALDKLSVAGFSLPPLSPTGYWSSGWPRLDLAPKLTDIPEVAGLHLPLFHADISALQAKLQSLPAAMWSSEEQTKTNVAMKGRSANTEKFKPGVQGIVLVFSDNNGEVVYQFPYYNLFRQELEPIINEVLGPIDALNIARMQFALMPPGTSDIKIHIDSGGYAKRGHRIHIPVITHENVLFDVCPRFSSIQEATAAAAAATAGGGATPGTAKATYMAPQPAALIDIEAFSDTTYDQVGEESSGVMSETVGHDNGLESNMDVDTAATTTAARARQLLNSKQHLLELQQQHKAAKVNSTPNISDSDAEMKCVNIPAPEGLVFELNNRVRHRVANPGPGPRVHLVIDVFETPRPRAMVPPGSVCEYGARLSALQQFKQIMHIASAGALDEQQLAHEVEVMLLAAGMACTAPDGQRIMPKPGQLDDDEAAQRVKQQEELLRLVYQGVAKLRGQSYDQHVAVE